MRHEKQVALQNKDRPFFIFKINYDVHRNNIVEFHLQIASLEHLDIMIKSQLSKTDTFTADEDFNVYDLHIQEKIQAFCKR